MRALFNDPNSTNGNNAIGINNNGVVIDDSASGNIFLYSGGAYTTPSYIYPGAYNFAGIDNFPRSASLPLSYLQV